MGSEGKGARRAAQGCHTHKGARANRVCWSAFGRKHGRVQVDSLLVHTAMDEDLPGLVETLPRAVAAHVGNLIESRMAHVAGKFAGILRVRVPAERHG